MRTTLTLDEDVAEELKEASHRSGKSFKRVVNETLRAGLAAAKEPPEARKYVLEPSSLGGVRPGIDLEKALTLADELETEEIRRELGERK